MRSSRRRRKARSFGALVLWSITTLLTLILMVVKTGLRLAWGVITFSPRAVIYGAVLLAAIGYGHTIVTILVFLLIVLYEFWRRSRRRSRG